MLTLHDALALRDLTDPEAGPHAAQLLVDRARDALTAAWQNTATTHRGQRIVTLADNYDALGYPPDGPARAARYTRYVDPNRVLRTQMSAVIPGALRRLDAPDDVLIVSPGITYRRDVVDRLHVGEPHQLDLWRITRRPVTDADMRQMIDTVLRAWLPGRPYRTLPAEHPYTRNGLQIDIQADDGTWVELGECGLAHPGVLARAGLERHHGLAMGLGVDRAVMLAKGIDDIRLLRSPDPRVAAQLLDLDPYRPVSSQPAARRDLSIAAAPGLDDELLGDRVREVLGADADWVEQVAVRSRTPAAELPASARERIGIADGQENLLVRVLLRHPTRSLPKAEANRLRDRVYAALHEGAAHQWSAAA